MCSYYLSSICQRFEHDDDTPLENDALLEVFLSQRNIDCSFEVGSDRNKEVIGAHKVALAMHSPVFKAMFYNACYNSDDHKNIRVTDIKPITFMYLLKYIYGGRKCVEEISSSVRQLRHLYYAARKYLMPRLFLWCRCELARAIDASNARQAYKFGKFFNDEYLLMVCSMIIQEKTQNDLGSSYSNPCDMTLQFLDAMKQKFIDSETLLHNTALKHIIANTAEDDE